MRLFRAALLCLMLLTDFAAIPVQAATTDATTNPVLANMQRLGAKFYYLGNRSGLDGWLVVKGQQMQIAYATPDNHGVMVGALFGQDGENITEAQINNLAVTNKEVADLLSSIGKEQETLVSGDTAVPATQPASAGTTSSLGALPSVNLSPGERLIHDLGMSPAVIAGNAGTPEVMMVMDPRCPHCQATWKAFHDYITHNQMHLRLIPIGAAGSDNERAAAILLLQNDPVIAWDKYIAGDASALAGTPSAAALEAVRANHTTIDNWKIESTPYLVYRSKTGKVKVVQGEPDKVSAILSDMMP